MKKLFLLLIFLSSLSLFSQEDPNNRDRFIDAEYHYLYEDFDKALDLYLEIYKEDSINANLNYRIGQSILHLTSEERFKRKDAIPYLEKSVVKMTNEYSEGSYRETSAPYEALFYLGNAYKYNFEFDKAVIVYERFISYLPPTDYYYIDYVKRESQACHNAKELISVPVKYETEGLNTIINSDSKVENCPVVNYSEDVIVYTSGKINSFSPDINMAAMNMDYKMDQIYFTRLLDSVWSEPISINDQINSGKSTVPAAITGDGKTLYTVRDDNDDGNIYSSQFEDGEWTRMKKLNKNINTSDWESHVSIAKDGKSLFFTSDRPGGMGGLDVYSSRWDEETEDWGEAINLGPTINSIYDEETPNIINDGKILYFSSQGHYGMGGFDIFYSSLLDNGNWTSPMNLGYPLNTVGNDLFYLPRKNGEYAIFPLNGNDRGENQQNDIYKIKVPVPGNDSTEIQLRGTVSIEDNNWPMYSGAKVTIINNENSDTLESIDIDLQTGAYEKIISAGSFKLIYFAPGYKPRTEYLLIPKIFAKTEFVLNVILKPISVSEGKFYVIKNVFFDFGMHDLTRNSKIEIEKLYGIMNENPDLYIEVIGYTDSRSSVEYNQQLSERRSKSVIDYLIAKGISSQRFIAIGMGESNPIAINLNPDGSDNPEGRQLNRRVEIKLMNYNGDKIVVEKIKVPSKLEYYNHASSIALISSDKALPKSYFEEKLTGKGFDSRIKNLKAQVQDGKSVYYFTGYKTKADALKDYNTLIDNGFPNSQIVEENASSQSDPVIQKIEGQFTIQIKALTIRVKSTEFTQLENVKIYKGKDGFFRYTYGEYKTKEEAVEAKSIITKDELIKDAFIVPIKNLKKY